MALEAGLCGPFLCPSSVGNSAGSGGSGLQPRWPAALPGARPPLQPGWLCAALTGCGPAGRPSTSARVSGLPGALFQDLPGVTRRHSHRLPDWAPSAVHAPPPDPAAPHPQGALSLGLWSGVIRGVHGPERARLGAGGEGRSGTQRWGLGGPRVAAADTTPVGDLGSTCEGGVQLLLVERVSASVRGLSDVPLAVTE